MHGTHNGMKSIVENLKTEEFPRIRIGIGKPENKEEMIQYVIGAIPKKEMEELDKGVNKAKEAVKEIIISNINNAMNIFN